MNRLEGKVALVTGASRGIGRGVALRMAEEGADVLVNYHTHRQEAEEVADQITALGQRALVWQADVADREAVARMYAAGAEKLGHIDIAVANAAFSVRSPVIDAHWQDVLRTIQVSQFGVFHTCQMAAQQMVRQVLDGRKGGQDRHHQFGARRAQPPWERRLQYGQGGHQPAGRDDGCRAGSLSHQCEYDQPWLDRHAR